MRKIIFWLLGFLCPICFALVLSLITFLYTSVFPKEDSVKSFLIGTSISVWVFLPGLLTGCLIFFNELYDRRVTYIRLMLRCFLWSIVSYVFLVVISLSSWGSLDPKVTPIVYFLLFAIIGLIGLITERFRLRSYILTISPLIMVHFVFKIIYTLKPELQYCIIYSDISQETHYSFLDVDHTINYVMSAVILSIIAQRLRWP